MDVEPILRRAYDAYSRRQPEEMHDAFSPEFRMHMRPGWPSTRRRRAGRSSS